MPISQNALFSGEAASDAEFRHPEGYSIASSFKIDLSSRGWQVSEIDNWRDSGWSLIIGDKDSKLELVFAKLGRGAEWFLQISPSYVPGLFGKLIGRKASARPEEINRLSIVVHQLLIDRGFAGMKWCWDGYPGEGTFTPAPFAVDVPE